VQIVCPDNAPAIAQMLLGVEGERTYTINNIRLYCGLVAVGQLPAGYPTVAFDGPEIGAKGRFFWAGQRCPDGLIAVGIHGKSGIWLDSVGFICGALTLVPPPPPKPAAPARPKLTVATQNPFAILVEWGRPVPANNIEWYSIDQVKDKHWVTLPTRYTLKSFIGRIEYPDVSDASERQAFRVCAENSAHRTCSPETWYYGFAQPQDRVSAETDRASVSPPRATAVKPSASIAQASAALPRAVANNVPNIAAAPLPDLNSLATRGAELALQDPLAAELRNRVAEGAPRRGFDIGFGIWEGNTAPGPGKQRVHDALSPPEQPGFDIAAAYSLPGNKYAKLANVGAAIGNADPALATARNAENDVFFWLGFNIASGIFGDPAAGSLGNTATGPGSLGIRNELNAPGQRGFNAATALHLNRHYK
jgi:hypothetical protein